MRTSARQVRVRREVDAVIESAEKVERRRDTPASRTFAELGAVADNRSLNVG
jgi:hypothetical protein